MAEFVGGCSGTAAAFTAAGSLTSSAAAQQHHAIAAHFGGYQAWEKSFACPQPDGIWYDTSSSLMFLSDDDAKRMLDRFGVERFLYGTDFPMWTPKTEIQRFLDKPLGLTQQEKEDVLYNNFARLFSLA